MRRILAVCTALLLLLGLAGCAGMGGKSEKLTVICTVFPPYDFVRQIAGDNVEVTLLLKPGQESHTYEPTPRDILDIGECDLFISVGGESEAWVADILASVDTPPRTLKLLDCVEPLHEEHDHGDEVDEHVWTSPKNAMAIVTALTDALCELDEKHGDTYRQKATAYQAELTALDTEFAAAVAGGRHNTLVFGDRFPFRYLAEEYGLSCHSPYQGCDSHAEPSAATVAALVDLAKAEAVPVVLYIEFSNQQMADTLAEATGAEKRLFHSCHNVTKAEMESGATYLSLMRGNVAVLKEALS
ncbi:MAG: zinc ABC transporter substrate-binding protein [Clostridia bacterium]|nr:zinc ABC transporter substrate-binding protein [Clostridia bacterium]